MLLFDPFAQVLVDSLPFCFREGRTANDALRVAHLGRLDPGLPLHTPNPFAPAENLPEHPGFHIEGLLRRDARGIRWDRIVPPLGFAADRIVIVDPPIPVFFDERVRHVGYPVLAQEGDEVIFRKRGMKALAMNREPRLMAVIEPLPEVLEPQVAGQLLRRAPASARRGVRSRGLRLPRSPRSDPRS